MSKIFSRWEFTTASGVNVPIPTGISIGRGNGYKTIFVDSDGNQVAFTAQDCEIHAKLTDAINALLTLIRLGATPGYFKHNKQRDAEQSFPVGISLTHHEASRQTTVSVSYPCLARNRAVMRTFYVGTPDTWESKIDSVLEKAIAFRQEKMTLYTEEFVRRAVHSLKLLEEHSPHNALNRRT